MADTQAPSFGRFMWAALIVVIGVAALEEFNVRYAWALAFIILMAVFFRYPAAMEQINKIFHLGGSGTTPQERG